MSETAILHVCQKCGKTFSSPSVCEDGTPTIPETVTVSSQQFADLMTARMPSHDEERLRSELNAALGWR